MNFFEACLLVLVIIGAISVAWFLCMVLRDLWGCLCDWLRIKRFLWMTAGDDAFLDEDQLRQHLHYAAMSGWWREVRDESSWCRVNDFEAGMLAAAKHLLRERGIHVVKSRRPHRRRTDADGRAK